MNIVLTIILAVQILTAVGMIGLILVQHGKGADMGAAFGSGGSGSLFGASGSANFLSRTTSILAAIFFVCTLALAYFGGLRPAGSGSVLERSVVVSPPPAPAASGAALIPGNTAPVQPASGITGTAPATSVVPAAPVQGASGATQIPTK